MAAGLITLAEWYLYAGLAISVVFLGYAIGRLDPNARGVWVFRPMMVPGVTLIWPLVLWRWWVASRGEDALARHRPPRGTQDWLALALACAIPVIVLSALLIRQDGPFEAPAVKLEEE